MLRASAAPVGRFRGDDVYLRSDVCVARRKEAWLREGREVLPAQLSQPAATKEPRVVTSKDKGDVKVVHIRMPKGGAKSSSGGGGGAAAPPADDDDDVCVLTSDIGTRFQGTSLNPLTEWPCSSSSLIVQAIWQR